MELHKLHTIFVIRFATTAFPFDSIVFMTCLFAKYLSNTCTLKKKSFIRMHGDECRKLYKKMLKKFSVIMSLRNSISYNSLKITLFAFAAWRFDFKHVNFMLLECYYSHLIARLWKDLKNIWNTWHIVWQIVAQKLWTSSRTWATVLNIVNDPKNMLKLIEFLVEENLKFSFFSRISYLKNEKN